MNTKIASLLIGSTLLVPAFASAHSTVTPSQSLTSKYETFTLNVPTEKEIPTTALRLVIPAGLERVTPIVKPGWTIRIDKDENGNITEIRWSGGSIPAGQKDMFLFSARTPAEPTSLIWKTYQTYSDGEVVAWDRDPSAVPEGKEHADNPYSITEVAADAASIPKNDFSPTNISLVALALSILAIVVAFIRRSA